MRINQFALKDEKLAVMKKELTEIGFLPEDTNSTKELWRSFLEKSFPQYQSKSSIYNLWQRMLGTKTSTLAEFFESSTDLSAEIFYRVALQLLQVEVEDFLQVEDVLETTKECGIPVISGDFKEKEVLIKAWYQLLNTHNTKGLTFLDDLAARGFYQGKDLPKPYFFNGKSQGVFDMHQVIKEVVYVESDLDTDEDGKRDLLKIEIIRPKESSEGLKVPVLFTASPYDQGVNRKKGNEKMHEVNVPLTRKTPKEVSYEEIAFKGRKQKLPEKIPAKGKTTVATETFQEEKVYSLNDYLLARGFASVYGAGIGTKDSDGIQTCGSIEQTESMKNIVEWLAGNRRAFTNRTDFIEITPDWCNGKVAMTGRSYLGTLATAVATTGVKGLETIISEAAISNWYQYYRDNGLVVAPGGFPGEDCDVLAEETFSRSLEAGDYLKIKPFFDEKQKEMAQLQDRKTGNYNTFWDERNYLPQVKNIKCDIFMVHGLNDWNVKPRHVYQLWQELEKLPVAKKIILHQGEHIYINNFPSFDFHDIMNLWLSYKLYGQENQAAEIIPPVIFQDNLEAEKWQALENWEKISSAKKEYYVNGASLKETPGEKNEKYHVENKIQQERFTAYTKDINLWEKELKELESPLKNARLLSCSEPFLEDLLLSGAPRVTLKVASSVDFGMLNFQLVDYGMKKRLKVNPTLLSSKGLLLGYDWRSDALKEFQYDQETPFKMITKGHLNLQNRRNSYAVDDLKAQEFVEIQVELQPTLYKVPKGHQLGLIIYGTDFGMTVRGNQAITYTISSENAKLTLPLQ